MLQRLSLLNLNLEVSHMTEKEKRFTLWYDEMDGSDFPLVGKKNANLGEMIKAGIPVSPGYAITIYANDKFLVDTGIKAELEKQKHVLN